LLGLFFDTEDGGDLFLRNVGWFFNGLTGRYVSEYKTLQT
jgi:hypothetical protein